MKKKREEQESPANQTHVNKLKISGNEHSIIKICLDQFGCSAITLPAAAKIFVNSPGSSKSIWLQFFSLITQLESPSNDTIYFIDNNIYPIDNIR